MALFASFTQSSVRVGLFHFSMAKNSPALSIPKSQPPREKERRSVALHSQDLIYHGFKKFGRNIPQTLHCKRTLFLLSPAHLDEKLLWHKNISAGGKRTFLFSFTCLFFRWISSEECNKMYYNVKERTP